ncbi:MAG: ATP-grasp domain-containing protein, partial [Roseivirga sp.]|uniref:ATP-grasp domain-containing protein n=1 Tax=Roseivirga sp. TaxID=1964215 RepID=UPI001B2F28CD
DEKIKMALTYDHKVLIEQLIVGKEVECSVLGNEEPKASLPGEIVTNTDFYDFESKYIDSNASKTQIPASITEEQISEVRSVAVKAYQTMGCQGLARVDFFVTVDGEILINEINTLPGFTNISMYPKMWEATGIGYSELLSLLIELAINKHKSDASLNVKAREVK